MLPLWLFLSLLAGAAGARLIFGRRPLGRSGPEAGRLRSELQRREELDAARVRFFGNIAHELRTPLTLVLGQIEAAQVEDDRTARGHMLRVAARNARRIELLAEQSLQLTRLDAGILEARPRDVDVVPYLESLVLSFEELAERKGVLLEFFGRPRSIPGRVDTDHLTTIVSNLVSNALKYAPAGGRVGVAVEALPGDDGGVLQLVVADTGPGIELERQPQIFDRFARGPEDDRLHPSGAGIGLALVRELARLHGGDAAVESEPGCGARFVVTLPHAGPVAEHPEAPLTGLEGRPEITEELLAGRAGSVGRIAHSVGFADQAHFTRTFKREFGMTPTAYRREAGSELRTPAGPAVRDPRTYDRRPPTRGRPPESWHRGRGGRRGPRTARRSWPA